MRKKLIELRQQKAESIERMRALLDAADAEKRDLTETEQAEYDGLEKGLDGFDKKIETEERLEAREREIIEVRRKMGDSGPSAPAIIGKVDNDDEFRTIGEFLHAIRFNQRDRRLQDIEYREMSAGVGAEGGFAIPTNLLPQFMQVQPQDAIFRPRATVIPAGTPPDGEIGIVALDQSAAQNMEGGVTVSWIDEGGTKPETSAKVREVKLKPHEVAGHIIVTDKLLRNWTASDALLRGLLRRAVLRAEDSAFFAGNGVGKPLGILNSPAAIAVNRATANQIAFADVVSMLSNAYGSNPVWIASRKTLPQLANIRDTGNNNLWIQSASAGVPGSLNGIPLIWHEKSPTLGTKGDLILADLSYYLIKDGSGPFVAASEHVYFTTNKTVIKVFWNVDGSPWLTEALQPDDWSGTSAGSFSPFVVLDVP